MSRATESQESSGAGRSWCGFSLKINCKFEMLTSQADKIQTNLRTADEDEDI